ncbi:hypothetical protein [Primorskyibacter flagellatus]|uniref:Uncharacterized protein n=1 Tax=Primorskyibacter flagellatus TaxID=1387277 RepID=A0A1W2D2J2_9RHOB|nr:hypothetical protein [Primorskyibacter flagellatus]SMC91302.1 hypothetical protein SAMN06295998_11049 [Primorskyibacter flagellatus]
MLNCLCLLICLTGTLANAGAWPRPEGTGFASVATRLSFDDTFMTLTSYSSAYLEYGLNGRHTLGLDAGYSSDGTSRAIVFVRQPLSTTKAGSPIAAELGLGVIDTQTVLRPGISWGRGLDKGWMAADALAEIQMTGATDLKLDLTLGLKDDRGRMLILQLQTGKPFGRAATAQLAPSVVVPFGKSRHLEVGASADLLERRNFRIKFGLWQDF